MNQVINLFNSQEVTEKEIEELNETASDFLDRTITELKSEEAIESFILITTNQENDIVIRSSGMPRKEAFWLLSMAVDHAKYGE